MLYTFYLCTVGFWDWDGERFFQPVSRWILAFDFLLAAIVIAMGVVMHSVLIPLPVVAVLIIAGVHFAWKQVGNRAHKFTLSILLGSFAVAVFRVFGYEPIFGIAFSFLGVLVAWLNRDFYRFFVA